MANAAKMSKKVQMASCVPAFFRRFRRKSW